MPQTYLIFEPESPEQPVLVFAPQDGCYVIGRKQDTVDICLNDKEVSRVHALVFIENNRALIQDLDSTKGVIIDGKRIAPETSVPIAQNNNVMVGGFLMYITTEIEPGVQSSPIIPGIYAGKSEDEVRALKRKVVDVTGKTIDGSIAPMPASLKPLASSTLGGGVAATLDGGVGDTLGGSEAPHAQAFATQMPGMDESVNLDDMAAAAQQDNEQRYTFPPMPKVKPEDQDKVDRFIYRRINPLFDQVMQERTGGASNRSEAIRDAAEDALRDILQQQAQHIPGGLSEEEMLKLCIAAFLDYGPLQGLFGDETVTEVMVNSHNDIFIEQSGNLFKSHLRFWDEGELRRVIEKMVMITNRRIDEQQPYQDTRLEDGSRVNIIIRPISLGGDSITIRKFPNKRLGIQDLLGYKSMSKEMGLFLEKVVGHRANVVVSGGTGSGKTTLLNVLSNFIPNTERVVTIEDAAELRLVQPNKVTLEARPKSLEGGGAVTIRDLVINALRMRPDRIVVGECRGGEALDMLQAMNTGHDGSLTTLHANSPRDAIGRLETMCLMSGMELPAKAIRSQIVSAVHFIVQQSRLAGGLRKVTSISEVLGLEGEQVVMQEIFRFTKTGVGEDGKAQGYFEATGVIPQYVSQLREDRIEFPIDIFNPQ